MTEMTQLSVTIEDWPLNKPFTISRGADLSAIVVVVRLTRSGATGWGEATPYARYGETPEGVKADIEAYRAQIGRDPAITVDQLGLKGAAANALDCALIDLAAKLAGEPAWHLLGEAKTGSLQTTTTVPLETPETMAEEARSQPGYPLIKVKLGAGEGDLDRIEAIRMARPDARLICDANEGWTLDQLKEYAPRLHTLGVEMVEQPCPAGDDEGLRGLDLPVILCADEACHTADDVPGLVGKYQMVNIKLDKTGGLHGALDLVRAAKAHDMKIMIGCMLATSLAMAPGMIIGQHATYVDLDAPLALKRDRENALHYSAGQVRPASSALWG